MEEKRDTAAVMEDFDSFWEAPDDIEKGYGRFGTFYRHNYLKFLPENRNANILVVSCGPGYMVHLLNQCGYTNVVGIDSVAAKIEPALSKNLNCRHAAVFDFLEATEEVYDVIFCEQEINHLTKSEIFEFLQLCKTKLNDGGTLIIHSLNGANPLVGIENLALNVDHFNIFTEKSIVQLLEHFGYQNIQPFPLKLYVFYKNPLNYVGIVINALLDAVFRLIYTFYGKNNTIFTKKIGVVGRK
jgi:SAM-dependent methyltransferase